MRDVEGATRVERLKPLPINQHAHLDAGVPGLARRQLDLEDDVTIPLARRGRRAGEAHRDAAMNACGALLALILIVMFGAVIESQFVIFITPAARALAVLEARAFGLDEVCKVRVNVNLEGEGGRLVGVVRQVNVFVDAVADKARDAQLERLLGLLAHLTAALVGRPGADARRQDDVIAEP